MLYRRSKKPNAHWWVRFTMRGTEVAQSSGTDRKDLAEAFEQQLREAIWNEQNLGIEIHTWEEACERWTREKSHKRSIARDHVAIRALAIDGSSAIQSCVDWRPRTSGARELAVYRSILNACVRWGWLDKAPRIEIPREEKHEPRWITKEQFERLCEELPPHAIQLARFAVSTGLRQKNVYRLRWENVDVPGHRLVVSSTDAKGKRPIAVPLNADARQVVREQAGRNDVYVFTDDRGRAPVGSIKTCWLKATKRAALEGFRFHDLRHTWAAWHVLNGTPPMILKELGGWSSLALVERYGHLGTGHLADWADNSSAKTAQKRRK